MRPFRGNADPSDSLIVTSYALSFGSTSLPAATARSSPSRSFSETLNGTQIGSTCQTSVSSVSLAVTRLPSDLTERLDRPVIGALTFV